MPILNILMLYPRKSATLSDPHIKGETTLDCNRKIENHTGHSLNPVELDVLTGQYVTSSYHFPETFI